MAAIITTATIITQHQNLAQRQYLHMSQKFMLLISTSTTKVIGVKYFPPTITNFTFATNCMTIVLFIIVATTITMPIQATFTIHIAPITTMRRLTI